MVKYIIMDWAGNIKWGGMQFKSFEAAWAEIYAHYSYLEEKAFDEQMQEFIVVEK